MGRSKTRACEPKGPSKGVFSSYIGSNKAFNTISKAFEGPTRYPGTVVGASIKKCPKPP